MGVKKVTTTIYLIRSGETNCNRELRFPGRIDIPLNPRGEQQALQVGTRFEWDNFSAIYSSPLSRATQTAIGIALYHNLEIQTVPELQEISGGELEWGLIPNLAKRYPEAIYNMRYKPFRLVCPGGESARQVYDRVAGAMERIVRANDKKVSVVVSHGFAIATYLHYVTGKHFQYLPSSMIHNTGVCKITYGEDFQPHVEYLDNIDHLSEGGYQDPNEMIQQIDGITFRNQY